MTHITTKAEQIVMIKIKNLMIKAVKYLEIKWCANKCCHANYLRSKQNTLMVTIGLWNNERYVVSTKVQKDDSFTILLAQNELSRLKREIMGKHVRQKRLLERECEKM